jgi:hypothetical protein
MAEEREKFKPDVEAHGHAPRSDDADPDELKLKLANDEDDDVEGHRNAPSNTP